MKAPPGLLNTPREIVDPLKAYVPPGTYVPIFRPPSESNVDMVDSLFNCTK